MDIDEQIKHKLELIDIKVTGMSWEELAQQYETNITINILGEDITIPFSAVAYNSIVYAINQVLREDF